MILKSLLEENSGLIVSTLGVLSGFVNRNFTLLLFFINGFVQFIFVTPLFIYFLNGANQILHMGCKIRVNCSLFELLH